MGLNRLAWQRRALVASAWSCAASPLWAQTERPKRLVVTFPGGSPPDLMARALVPALQADTGRWRVENHPGASGTIGAALVARGPADGGQLLVGVPATLAIAGFLFARLPYDMAADLVPVAGIASGAQVLAVSARSRLASFEAWVEAVRRQGRYARVGHSGVATSIYLQLRYWIGQQPLPVLPVAYSGVGPIVRDLLGGHVDVYAGPIGGVLEAIRSRAAVPLAVTGEQRDPRLPQVPTLGEIGWSERIGPLWTGIFARSGESAERLAAWSRALLAAQQNGSFAALLNRLAVAPLALDAENFRALVRADRERYAALIREMGPRPTRA
jgi:tripartite-type tricarboxylate transporter receptor subunit TctC